MQVQYGTPPEKDTLRNVQRRAAIFLKNDCKIYLKEQHYCSVTKMIHDLGWKDLAFRRKDACQMLVYKIVNREVNVSSQGMLYYQREERGKVKPTINWGISNLT